MFRGRRAGWPSRVGACALLVASTCVFALTNDTPAFAEATRPPPFPTNCPAAQNPAPGAALTAKFTPYEVPFKGIISGGLIQLPPDVEIPNLYASVCGLVQLPQLTGTIQSANIALATPLIYIGGPHNGQDGLEALPATVKFGELIATINLTPAHNGGLDITLHGDTTASVTTLGMTCGITLNATFTTLTSGKLSGQPVTGPTKSGQAEVVSNSFSVPPVVGSNTGLCPPSIAQTFNQLLGLPVGPGVGTFVAPFCFDFELEGVNNPTSSKACPWPSA
jgi:hypothetical protein